MAVYVWPRVSDYCWMFWDGPHAATAKSSRPNLKLELV